MHDQYESLSKSKIVILINYLRRHHVLTFKEIEKRVGSLKILTATTMEQEENKPRDSHGRRWQHE